MALSDSNYFHCDDLADVDSYSLDPEIAALCNEAAMIADFAAQTCVDFVTAMRVRMAQNRMRVRVQLHAMEQRLFTGYMPEAVRRNVRHRLYCDGLRTPKDKTARDMAALARGKAVA